VVTVSRLYLTSRCGDIGGGNSEQVIPDQ